MSPLTSAVRLLAVVAAIAVGAPIACGGKVVGPGGGAGSSGSAGSGGTAGATGGTAGSGGSAGSPVGGSFGSSGSGGSDGSPTGTCVDVLLSDFDTSCNQPSDCTVISTGTICTGGCECGGSAINVSGLAKYEAEVAGITPGLCGCPAGGLPTCVAGTCKLCLDSTTPGCGPTPLDAGTDSSTGTSVNCSYKVSGYAYCYTYDGLTPSEEKAVESSCGSAGGVVVASCPTTGLSGCCEDISSGGSFTYGYCIYGVPASTISSLMSACAASKGTWTP